MNLNQIAASNKQRIMGTLGAGHMDLRLCVVDDVDVATMTADIHLLETGTALQGVPFCLPMKFFDKGILFVPEPQSMGILAVTSKQQMMIISFISLSRSDDTKEGLLPGEILIQSKGYSFIKEDLAGNLIIGSKQGNFIILTADDEIKEYATSKTISTVAKEIVSGIVNGTIAEIEKIYDKDISSALSVEQIVENLSKNENISITKPSPVVIIEKGNVLDDNGNKLKLEIDANPANNADMCYRITVKDVDNNVKFTGVVDKAGNAKISGNKLILDFNTFDYSACDTVIP